MSGFAVNRASCSAVELLIPKHFLYCGMGRLFDPTASHRPLNSFSLNLLLSRSSFLNRLFPSLSQALLRAWMLVLSGGRFLYDGQHCERLSHSGLQLSRLIAKAFCFISFTSSSALGRGCSCHFVAYLFFGGTTSMCVDEYRSGQLMWIGMMAFF